MDITNTHLENNPTKTNTRVDYNKNGVKYFAVFTGKLSRDQVEWEMIMKRQVGRSAISGICYQRRTSL